MADSAIFCNGPSRFSSLFINELNITDYFCPVDLLPYEYPDWNEKWYSPVCRGWYQEQFKKQDQNIITDLYIYADGIEYGVTTCAPILRKTESISEFFGAFCLDVTPGGDLNNYFDFGEDKFQASYLLFNIDAAFRR